MKCEICDRPAMTDADIVIWFACRRPGFYGRRDFRPSGIQWHRLEALVNIGILVDGIGRGEHCYALREYSSYHSPLTSKVA